MIKYIFVLLCVIVFFQSQGQTFQGKARVEKLKPQAIDTLYRNIKPELDFLSLQPGDTVADIGTYDGYYPVVYSIWTDSVVFYLNDKSEKGMIYFEDIKSACAALRNSALTNQFVFIQGSDTLTELPHGKFTKVILRDVMHHFNQRDKMMDEIKLIMKPSAALILFEPVHHSTHENKICAGALTENEIMNFMAMHNFVCVSRSEEENGRKWFEFRIK